MWNNRCCTLSWIVHDVCWAWWVQGSLSSKLWFAPAWNRMSSCACQRSLRWLARIALQLAILDAAMACLSARTTATRHSYSLLTVGISSWFHINYWRTSNNLYYHRNRVQFASTFDGRFSCRWRVQQFLDDVKVVETFSLQTTETSSRGLNMSSLTCWTEALSISIVSDDVNWHA